MVPGVIVIIPMESHRHQLHQLLKSVLFHYFCHINARQLLNDFGGFVVETSNTTHSNFCCKNYNTPERPPFTLIGLFHWSLRLGVYVMLLDCNVQFSQLVLQDIDKTLLGSIQMC